VLHEFITKHREEIIRRCIAKVATRTIPPLTAATINNGVPVFLDQLVEALHPGFVSDSRISESAVRHGHDLLLQGYTMSQVVHDYGDVCQVVTQLALELDEPIATTDFRVLNRCLDDAIAGAVSQYGTERNQSTLEIENARGTERMGFLAHELRNLVNTGLIAFEVLKSGEVGMNGSTGEVLNRSLMGIRALAEQSLAEVRLAHGVHNAERFPVTDLIQELVPSARMEARARGATLVVAPIEGNAGIEGDRQILAAVIVNLLQNGFKFTRPGTAVTLRVGAGADRVLIEVEDECGGLVNGNVQELFRPYEQRNADRSGLGLGLAFSRWAAEVNNGRLYTRNLPGKGCIFTLDLPRRDVSVTQMTEIKEVV
jgi:signal transduction histidine kinase